MNKLIVSSIAETLNLKVTNDFIFSEMEGFQKNEMKKYISKIISGDAMMAYDNLRFNEFKTYYIAKCYFNHLKHTTSIL